MTANGPEDGAPALSLRLQKGHESFAGDMHLYRRRKYSGVYLWILTFNTERETTLVCNGLYGKKGRGPESFRALDLLGALQSGLLELTEVGKEDVISFQSAETLPLERIHISPTPAPDDWPMCITVNYDSTKEVWKSVLQHGKTYEIRFSKNGGEVWAYYTDDEPSDSAFETIPAAQRLRVDRDTTQTLRLTVNAEPDYPNLFAKLHLPEECHRSGTPPFTLTIEISTDSEEVLTVNKSRTPFSCEQWLDLNGLDQLIKCVDVNTGEEPDFPNQFCCFDSDPHGEFPKDDDFVELGPGQVWRFRYTIENCDAPGSVGGLEWLEVGHTYTAEIAEDIAGFGRWTYGKKEDLLKGDIGEKKSRWKAVEAKSPPLMFRLQEEPVVFRVVD